MIMDICKTCQYYMECNKIELRDALWKAIDPVRADGPKGEMIDTFSMDYFDSLYIPGLEEND